ncbi:transcription initiation factor IID, 31kD subunit-domain-containing protein [Sphaerosporella brunnea]|uniref:Transcription initiation factor IID, 31kD subunit-domain-containing protein n=1 Tax=Sphaerosporella brunnea TaxID=1250544 RepID=A0A5J5EHH6_9PEZI|nr:transcription initiation factor IID, 31kD subunit-domain-containing protein [Sphaerosporella brunnea]
MANPNGDLANSSATLADPATITAASAAPAESQQNNASSPPKPRDARLIHLILSSMNVTAYQDRVPLMLMDFAYRYTSGVLQDALLFSDAINNTANTGAQNPPSTINNDDLRMAIASRVNHQFNPSLPKEFLLDIAQERNRVALPTVGPEFGVRLPPEKYCLTGVNWDLKAGGEEWMDVEDDEEEDMGLGMSGMEEDTQMDSMDDIFGEDSNMVDA